MKSPSGIQATVSSAPSGASVPSQNDLTPCVERAQRGDLDAFRELVQQLQKPLYYTLVRMLRDHDDAADITQRAFLKAWQGLDSLREPGAFKGWLFRIATNLARNHIRNRSRRQHEPLDEAHAVAVDAVAESNLDRKQQVARLEAALEVLSPKQREVLLLRLEGDLSHREIADAIGSSEGSVRVHFHQAVKRLKAALGNAS